MTRAAIVIADDNLLFREMVRDLLAGDGFEVACVEDGAAAIQLLELSAPKRTLLLLDLVMPGVDGFSVISKVRSEPSLGNVRVFVVTGLRDRPEDRAALEGRQVVGFIGKDSPPQTIVERVKTVVEAW